MRRSSGDLLWDESESNTWSGTSGDFWDGDHPKMSLLPTNGDFTGTSLCLKLVVFAQLPLKQENYDHQIEFGIKNSNWTSPSKMDSVLHGTIIHTWRLFFCGSLTAGGVSIQWEKHDIAMKFRRPLVCDHKKPLSEAHSAVRTNFAACWVPPRKSAVKSCGNQRFTCLTLLLCGFASWNRLYWLWALCNFWATWYLRAGEVKRNWIENLGARRDFLERQEFPHCFQSISTFCLTLPRTQHIAACSSCFQSGANLAMLTQAILSFCSCPSALSTHWNHQSSGQFGFYQRM